MERRVEADQKEALQIELEEWGTSIPTGKRDSIIKNPFNVQKVKEDMFTVGQKIRDEVRTSRK